MLACDLVLLDCELVVGLSRQIVGISYVSTMIIPFDHTIYRCGCVFQLVEGLADALNALYANFNLISIMHECITSVLQLQNCNAVEHRRALITHRLLPNEHSTNHTHSGCTKMHRMDSMRNTHADMSQTHRIHSMQIAT